MPAWYFASGCGSVARHWGPVDGIGEHYRKLRAQNSGRRGGIMKPELEKFVAAMHAVALRDAFPRRSTGHGCESARQLDVPQPSG